MKLVNISENTLLILLDQVINHDNFMTVSRVVNYLKEQFSDEVLDIVPSYTSIHITFNLMKISGMDFRVKLKSAISNIDNLPDNASTKKVIEIPVYYGSDVALDLAFIATQAKLTEQEVVNMHSEKIYDVYAIGFAPGFAYLGNVDERIATPRKETPRKKVAKGSLGIADQQTAIYPSESPGGWQIIGKTPLSLIDYNSDNLTQFSSGDKVKFKPISQSEYLDMGGVL